MTTSLVDIDVALTDIVFEPRLDGRNDLDGGRPTAVVDYAIEGVVHPPESPDGEGASAPYRVYVTGYEKDDRLDRDEDFDPRSVCYIANDENPDEAWRTNIYIESFIFRRLVELYASKRIDSARISILLKVLRDPSGKVDVPALRHPMLRNEDGRRSRHSRAHLMSVQTALNAAPSTRRSRPED
jgi:hypothetical protein